tara:strand:+ start:8541 stop:10169 length:1629 start_codon:yes stop_codon:yes gene_type:complete
MSCSHDDGHHGPNHAHDAPGSGSVPALKPVKRPEKARVLSEADLELDRDLEAGLVGNGGIVGDAGHAHAHGTATEPSNRRPGKARVLSEAELDAELDDASANTTYSSMNSNPKLRVTQFHGHSHVGGHGPCHGFEEDLTGGGWFNAGHAENVFGGTRIGRRIIPVARAEKVKKKLYCAFAISGAYAVAEIIAAEISGSTALLADAAHMLSDFFSYALSIGILWITMRAYATKDDLSIVGDDNDDEKTLEEGKNNSGRPKKVDRLTFGVARLEVLGALGIIIIVWIATGVLVVEAARRLVDPPTVDGRVVVLTAIGGLVVDCALLHLLSSDNSGQDENTHGHSHGAGELSSRAMFVHVVGDLAGTIVVCLGGAVIWSTGGRESSLAFVDPICTFIFCALVVYTTFPFALRMCWTLMEAAPPGLDPNQVAAAIQTESPAVVGVHCLHVWEVAPGKTALSAHIHVDATRGGNAAAGSPFKGEMHGGAMEEALRRSTRLCQQKFNIKHVTLQVTATPEQGGFAACGKTGATMDSCDKCQAEIDLFL